MSGPPTRSHRVKIWAVVLLTLTGLVAAIVAVLAVTMWPETAWIRQQEQEALPLLKEVARLGGDGTILSFDFLAKTYDLSIDLSRTKIGDDELASLARMPAFRHVHELSLADTAVTDAGVGLLARCQALHALDLSRTKVTDNALRAIAGCRSLSTLSASGTKVTDIGVEALIQHRDTLDLISLDITDTPVNEEGVQKLKKAWPMLYIKPD